MKRFMIFLAFTVAASALALGQGGNVEQSIRALTEQLRQASLKGDAATFGVAQITFGPPTDYPVGTTPGAVAAGDFNNDGKLDLAVANSSSNDISILLGNADGTFQSAVNYSVGLKPVSIAVVDLNLDNKKDLAVAFQGDIPSKRGGISLLLGNGDGTFQPITGLASSDYPTGIVAGDFNGDRKPDLAISNTGGPVSVFLGNGDGTFRSAVNYDVTGDALSISVGDFNGDTKQDLLVTTVIFSIFEVRNGKASVLLGKGDGSFQAATETSLGGAAYLGAIGDFNGDGHLDLAFITKQNVFSIPSIEVVLGRGDGTFGAGAFIDSNNFDSFMTVADLNADGTPDLLALSFPVVPAARVFLGQGDGTFQLAQTVVFSSFGPGAAAIADFNGDLLPDLAVTMHPQNVVSILLNTTTDFTLSASALTPATVNPGQSATSSLTVGAANGFTGSVSLTCSLSPKPEHAPQCSISPSSVTPGTPATLTVTTTGSQAGLASPWGRAGLFYALWLPVCGLTLVRMVFPAQRKQRRLLGMLSCVSLFAALLLLPACGGSSGGSHGSSGTPPGTYTISVTGTSGVMHATAVTLKVQ